MNRNSAVNKTDNVNTYKISLKDFTSVFGLILLVIVSAALSPTFLKAVNLMNVLTQIAAPSLLAVGMTFVILTAGIDLSVGSVVALSGVVVAMTAPSLGWPLAVLTAAVIGILIGLFHGTFITKFNVPPFIATLAGLTAYRGLALVLTSAAALPINEPGYDFIGSGKIDSIIVLIIAAAISIASIFNYIISFKHLEKNEIFKKTSKMVLIILIVAAFTLLSMKVGGLSFQIVVAIVVILIFNFILSKTVFGREVYAVGGNIDAARLAGIKTNKNLMIVYAISGFLSALSGILVSARLASGMPQVANGGELDAIAAVVIGGTSFSGGIGTIAGTIVGVLLIGVLNNLLSLLNVPSDMKMVFKGVIILVAVVLDTKFRKQN